MADNTHAKAKAAAAVGALALTLAVPIIMKYEGLVTKTYRDPVGILTVCYGHTGPDVKVGQRYTPEQCKAMLYADMAKHATALSCIKRPLADHQAAAFVSFAFNVGNTAFCGSSLVRKANAGDMAGACAELSRWVYSKGQFFQGLANRRATERAMCEGRKP